MLALGLALPVAAQEVFSLPPGTASPSARPAGPVDADAPVVRPRPTQTATPQPSATPTAAPSATPSPATTAPRQPVARQTAAPRPAPAPATSAAAPADSLALPGTATAAATTALPTAIPTLAPAPAPSSPAPAVPEPASDWTAYAIGALVGALALLALIGGLMWWRRKSSAAPEVEFEPPVVAKPQPAPKAEATAAAPPPAPAPAPKAAPKPEGLEITLEARRLDASLMATTLAYQLKLTNHGSTPLSALAIEGDMVAAHSSLPVEQQIASPGQKLELRHALVELAAGESAEFKGELRLPLTAITPIRAGNAAYFVPLARLRVEAARAADEPMVIAQTFVIGELPEQPGGALRPFRLDLGPRTFGKLGQRAVG